MKKMVLFVICSIFLSSLSFAANSDGRQTVSSSGTPVALGTGSFTNLDVCAMLANTGIITVGFSPVASVGTRTGVPLNAGDCWHLQPVDSRGNLAQIKIDATVNSEGVNYTIYD